MRPPFSLPHGLKLAFFSLLVVMTCGLIAVALQRQATDVRANGSAVFSQTGFWNTPIPRFTPEDPEAAALRTQLAAIASGARTEAGPRFYTAVTNADTVPVALKDCATGVVIGPIPEWEAVPIPTGASVGANGEMIVYQPSSLTVWEFGEMASVNGQWQACSGGRLQNTSTSNGVYPEPYGLTSTGLSRAGGMVTIPELQTNQINHVVGLSLPMGGAPLWPALRGDGSGSFAPGQRLRLDPSFDITTLPQPARAIARAAQLYGFVVWDDAAAPTVHSESGNADLSMFPWDKLQILPAGYGQAGITPRISSFTISRSAVASGETVTFSWDATNVDSCTIPSVFSGQPARSTWQSTALTYSSNFSLVCGGVAGSASQQVSVQVAVNNQNPPEPELAQPIIITLPPVAGTLNILPEFLPLTEMERLYKVEYFKQARLIDTAIESPYGFDTKTLPDGEHQLELKLYYRGGDSRMIERRVLVANGDERLVFAAAEPVPSRLPRLMSYFGAFVGLSVVMAIAVSHARQLARTR